MATDIEKTGVEFRVLAALSPVSWNKLSFWGRAEDVIFSDNTTAQNKLGAITGITSDVNSVSQSLAASSYLVNYTSGEQYVLTIPAAAWSGSTTTVSGRDWYTYTVEVQTIILTHPEIYLAIDTVPDEDMEEWWTGLQMVADTLNNRLVFYIEEKPERDMKIGIKGVIKKTE